MQLSKDVNQDARRAIRGRNGTAVFVFLLAVMAVLTPLMRVDVYGRLGILLVITAVIELIFCFRQSNVPRHPIRWSDGAITLFMGLLLINSLHVAARALTLLLAGWFALDGLLHLFRLKRDIAEKQSVLISVAWGLLYLLIAVLLLFIKGKAMAWLVAVVVGARLFHVGLNLLRSEVLTIHESGQSVIQDWQLQDRPEIRDLAERMTREESSRVAIDRGWIITFLLILLAIHVGRMGFDRTFLGIMAPGFAVLGDVVMGLIVAFLIVMPVRLVVHQVSQGSIRRLWLWCLKSEADQRGWLRRRLQGFLSYWLRISIRLKQSRYSLRMALNRGLQTGLPIAAIIAATVPIWGMSWYFDTENWAAGIWNSWAEERTDVWREAMIEAVWPEQAPLPADQQFAIHPLPNKEAEDFAFIVIGDTGEGDGSQLSLKAQLLEVARREDVRFVLISSDVVYPTGAMRHYETNFWLPFMGVSKPVYAIPGNHDWYDALEAFAATFFEPEAARLAMRARVLADKRITSTTEGYIEHLIERASFYQSHYKVPTQKQQAPFFQMQTNSFALFAIDTGVLRRIDGLQRQWLEVALKSAQGKTKMAILGHPLYAGGHYQAEEAEDFAALHDLLRAHDVAIIMAGDTHDLEYYVERSAAMKRPILHFVNGGGGAYLSYGTSLAWPDQAATSTWAYFPSHKDVITKVDATTPLWKWPAWWWTKHFKGWPFSAEWLSAAFDSNVAPFYQSFVEVRVETSKKRILLIPYGVHGRLRWSDFDRSKDVLPDGGDSSSFVEWIVEMNP